MDEERLLAILREHRCERGGWTGVEYVANMTSRQTSDERPVWMDYCQGCDWHGDDHEAHLASVLARECAAVEA
jgi:hypothetical protein